MRKALSQNVKDQKAQAKRDLAQWRISPWTYHRRCDNIDKQKVKQMEVIKKKLNNMNKIFQTLHWAQQDSETYINTLLNRTPRKGTNSSKMDLSWLSQAMPEDLDTSKHLENSSKRLSEK